MAADGKAEKDQPLALEHKPSASDTRFVIGHTSVLPTPKLHTQIEFCSLGHSHIYLRTPVVVGVVVLVVVTCIFR